MIFDINAWLGSFPFRSLRDNTPETLIARLDRSEIDRAAVSQIEAIFHRNVQPANEKLVKDIEPFKDRLVPIATINPTYEKWEDDLKACHETLGMKGVRLFPSYHGYEIDSGLARQVLGACKGRGLPVFIPCRIEDVRQRNWMDPGKLVDVKGVANLMAAVPGATVVVPNYRFGFSGLPLWQDERVREQSWYVDFSLTEVESSLVPLIKQSGAKHVVFGTHVPFSYPGAALVKRSILSIDAETMEDISYRNAVKILGL